MISLADFFYALGAILVGWLLSSLLH